MGVLDSCLEIPRTRHAHSGPAVSKPLQLGYCGPVFDVGQIISYPVLRTQMGRYGQIDPGRFD